MLTLVGTYPPIRCGIATFNRDLREALLREGVPSQVAVVAHPEEVALHFPQEVVRVVAKEAKEPGFETILATGLRPALTAPRARPVWRGSDMVPPVKVTVWPA